MSLPELNTVIEGDCLSIMRGWGDKCVDCVITDIPYGVVNRESGGLRNLDRGSVDVVNFDESELTAEIARLVTGSVYMFCGTEQVSAIRATLVELGLSTRLCIWEKTNPDPMNGQHIWLSAIECCVYGKRPGATFNESCQVPVWRHPFPTGHRQHPTQKPDELMQRLVRASTNEGDTILDPFCGSGSTLAAAERLGRKWIGIDIDEHWCEVSRRRTAQKGLDFTTEDAA